MNKNWSSKKREVKLVDERIPLLIVVTATNEERSVETARG